MPRLPELSSPPRFKDSPPWSDNRDSVQRRLITLAWNDIESLASGSLTLRQLALKVGVSPPAVFNHFKGREDFARVVALGCFQQLAADIAAAADATSKHGRKPALETLCGAWLEFARKRPHHHQFMFASRYLATPDLKAWVKDLRSALGSCLTPLLGRKATDKDVELAWAMVLGTATLLSLGETPLNVPALVKSIRKALGLGD